MSVMHVCMSLSVEGIAGNCTCVRVPVSKITFRLLGKPYIIAVYPHEGWTTGGTRVCIVGMNFYEGVEVVFGTLAASAEVRAYALCQ